MSFIKYQKHLPVSTYKGGWLHNASCCGETCDDLPTSPLDKTDPSPSPFVIRIHDNLTLSLLFLHRDVAMFFLKGASRFKLINSETTNSHEFNNFKLCKKNDLKLKVFVFFREFEL